MKNKHVFLQYFRLRQWLSVAGVSQIESTLSTTVLALPYGT
jgi:hypothetical protein